MKLLTYLMLIISIFGTIGNTLTAQNDTTQNGQDLYDMDLESLMNIEIYTVSKKLESISEAPAIITVITPSQIEEYGVETLTELMTFVPGFTVADSYWKRQIVTARGVKMTLYNDKILMLINGIPAYDAAALEYYLDIMPVTAIKQIEIIRGPGSTLYGTNAFSAVINIITKDGKNNKEIAGYIKGGSLGTRSVGASVGNSIKDFSYFIGATIEDNDGYLKKDVIDEYGIRKNMLYEYDNDNIFVNLSYKDISLQSGYMHQKWTKFGPMPAFIYGNNNSVGAGGRAYQNKAYVNLLYNKKFSNKISAKITGHFDWMDKQTDIGQFGVNIYQNLLHIIDSTESPDYYRFGGFLYQTEAQLSYDINEKISIISGVSFERRTTNYLADLYSDLNGKRLFSGSTLEDSSENNPININDIGAFVQASGKLGKLGYIAGIRLTYLGINNSSYITPRAGLVYNFSHSNSVKLLYGEAFRGPGPQEQYYVIPMLVYGKDAIGQSLNPERIKTYELAVDQKIFKKYKLRANAYILNVFDIIGRREATASEIQIIDPNLPSTKIYDNLGKQNIKGIEVEIEGHPFKSFNFWANLTYKEGEVINKDTVTYNYIPFMENINYNLGASINIKKLKISPNIQYVGKREGRLVTNDSMVSIDPYALFNLVVSYKFNNKTTLALSAHNLLNSIYYYPEDVRKKIKTIPGGPGRWFTLKFSYKIAQ